jgi:hypothetical protein
MSDQNKPEIFNPFLDENVVEGGGGLWDGKSVTITKALTEVRPFTRGDGSKVIDEKTGEQMYSNDITIYGIADDEDKERREGYSAGKTAIPDGEWFNSREGVVSPIRGNSNAAKFREAVAKSGFDVSLFISSGRASVKCLEGARFLFKAVPKVNEKGEVKKNKKGYDEKTFVPVKFLGFKTGSQSPASSGVGASEAVVALADETVLGAISEAGGKITRAELIKAVSKKLAGTPDVNKVLALVAKDAYHTDKAWKRDGTGYSL